MIKFIEAIKVGVRRYKRKRMTDVVQQYAQCINDSGQLMLPLLVGLYSGSVTHIINRTMDDPAPLVDLLEAVNKCVDHYGPGLRAVLDAYAVEVADVSEHMRPQLEEFELSMQRMRTDVNPA